MQPSRVSKLALNLKAQLGSTWGPLDAGWGHVLDARAGRLVDPGYAELIGEVLSMKTFRYLAEAQLPSRSNALSFNMPLESG